MSWCKVLPPIVFLALLIGAWELYVRAGGIEDYVLPAPSAIWPEFWRMAPDLGHDIWITMLEAVVGLVVAAVSGALLALWIAWSKLARAAVYPVLVVSQAIPAIVLAPVLTVWLGFEELLPKIVVVALVGFFPIVVSTVDGLVRADEEQKDLVRSFGASRAQVLRIVQVPAALPSFFAGLKIAATYSVIAAVIGEWMGSAHGLGLVMTRAQNSFRADRVFVAVIITGLASLALFAVVSYIAKRATPWTAAALAGVLVCSFGLAACSSGGDDDDDAAASGDAVESRDVTLVLNWTPNTHHIGIYAAEEMGWYDDAGIDLTILEPTQNPAEPAVGAGEAEFGISYAEAVLPSRASDIPVVSIATILPVNDSALMSLAEDGIEGPADLAGMTYGGYEGALETELINRLGGCGGVDEGDINHISVGNVDYLAGLDADQFDFAWIFSGWDGLRATEVENRDINLMKFEDHLDCIPNWYTPVVIANEETIADDPELVRTFLAVTARGYHLAIDDPQRAADLMLDAVPETDETLLQASADYYATRFVLDGTTWGTQHEETWTTFEQFLEEAGLLEEPVDATAAFTNDLLPE